MFWGRITACMVMLAGCGRIHFDPLADDARTGDALVGAIGCGDGQREAFVDRVRFPTIAGCAATWAGQIDLRAARTGATCGDDIAMCAAASDACAIGWHLCMNNGDPADLTSR